ncbi:hypothetical protein AAMO2058_000373400 [Amorphochlora amoebiformis]
MASQNVIRSRSCLSSDGESKSSWVPLLPPQTKEDEGKICVVLDMDETMLHSEFGESHTDLRQHEIRQHATTKADFRLRVWYQNRYETIRVHMRPGLQTFLEKTAKDFEIVVFTAALPVYANAALDYIDTSKNISHRLFRESCVQSNGFAFVKDISKLGRDMSKVVLVDNSPVAMVASPDNSIPLVPFYDNKDDQELPKLLQTLYNLKMAGDVQRGLRQSFPGFRKQIMDFLALHQKLRNQDFGFGEDDTDAMTEDLEQEDASQPPTPITPITPITPDSAKDVSTVVGQVADSVKRVLRQKVGEMWRVANGSNAT